jgi:hypothetical protein
LISPEVIELVNQILKKSEMRYVTQGMVPGFETDAVYQAGGDSVGFQYTDGTLNG